MNGVRKEWLGSVLAQAIHEALEPLRECIEQTTAKLSVIESGIKAAAAGQEARVAAARSRTGAAVDELKRAVGIVVSADGDDAHHPTALMPRHAITEGTNLP